MKQRAQDQIDRIMWEAFDRAAKVLEVEMRRLLDAKPHRYTRFVLAVGWGPILFGPDGKILDQDKCCARARRLLTYANKFHDRHGADNREVLPTLPVEHGVRAHDR